MQSLIRRGLVLVVGLIVMSSNVGVAVAETTTTTATPATQETTTTTETVKPDPAKIKERNQKRIIDFKIKLDKAQETRMKTRCKAAQAMIVKAKTRSEEVKKRRLNYYTNIQERVTTLTEKLQVTGGKIDEITAAQALVTPQVLALSTAFNDYQQALDDAAATDCVADPIGFKAALEAARAQHVVLEKSFIALRKVVSENLQPALVNARKAIEASKKETK